MRTLGKTVYSVLRSCLRMPQGYYAAALVLGVLLFFLFRKERLVKRLAISLLCPYLFLVLGTTVLKRRTMASMRYFLSPFRLHRQILRNGISRSRYQVAQVLLNVLLLSPIGMLMPCMVKKKWVVVPVGFCFSLLIEVLQLVLRKGTFEVDDLINNTAGVVIGLGINLLGEKLFGRKRDPEF